MALQDGCEQCVQIREVAAYGGRAVAQGQREGRHGNGMAAMPRHERLAEIHDAVARGEIARAGNGRIAVGANCVVAQDAGWDVHWCRVGRVVAARQLLRFAGGLPLGILISAYLWVPEFAQGYVKDLRVRWALEEAGLPYDVELIDIRAPRPDAYLQWQIFGQVPAYRDDDVSLFESGAIVLHIARRSALLAPDDEAGFARVTSWVFAALNSVEPSAQTYLQVADLDASTIENRERREAAGGPLQRRLASLSAWLGEREYLEGPFSAGDLMMACVLRELVECGLLARFPTLDAYARDAWRGRRLGGRSRLRCGFFVRLNKAAAD